MIKIGIPTLAQRKKDIPALVSFFIKKANKELKLNIKGISNDALKILQNRSYEGNIRELKNTVYNSALNAHEDIIQEDNIKFDNSSNNTITISDIISNMLDKQGIENSKIIFESIEKDFYATLLKKSENITHLANHLDISRSTLRKILQEYKLQ